MQATLANARLAVREGPAAAEARLQPELVRLASSEDAAIGMRAFAERTTAEVRRSLTRGSVGASEP